MDWPAVLLPAVLTLIWGTDLALTASRWRVEHDVRSYRNFLRSLAIELGVSALFVRAIGVYLWPVALDDSRFYGYMAYGALFVIGGYALTSWWREWRRQRP